MLKKYFFTILFISWVVFITFLSLFSFRGVNVPSIEVPHMDKLVHFSFYFGFIILACLSFRELGIKNIALGKVLGKIIIFTIAFGIVIEVLQGVATTNRNPDLLDVFANSFGALCGSFVVKCLFSGKTSLKWLR